jgi:hypothetical protein
MRKQLLAGASDRSVSSIGQGIAPASSNAHSVHSVRTAPKIFFDTFFLLKVPYIHRGENLSGDQWNRLVKEAVG